MTSGWNLWMWLECIGVVSGWCCKEVYALILLIPILAFFLQQHSLLLCSFLKCFFHSLIMKSTALQRACTLLTIINPRRACAERATVVVSCVYVCVCVCVWGAKDQKEFGISVRKEKVKG